MKLNYFLKKDKQNGQIFSYTYQETKKDNTNK